MCTEVNTDPETGVRFGAIYGKKVPRLVDEIILTGINVNIYRIKKLVDEKISDIVNILSREFGEPMSQIEQKIKLYDAVHEYLNELESQFDISEQVYKAKIDGMHLTLTSLGGAALVIVERSPKIVRAKFCSPCVPNAIDLEALCNPPEGYEGYGIIDDWMDSEL